VRRPLLIVLAVVAPAAGCGGEERPAAPLRAVQLEVLSPGDATTVEDGEVLVRGRVRPTVSSVEVLGREVDVAGGGFSTAVELEEGANLIDVAASAPGRRPASTAVRVVREVPVEVPDLAGDAPDEAAGALEGLGLQARLRRGGGLLDSLLPGEAGVCSTDPEAGSRVRPGTTVDVEVARVC
jgi:Glucodextranase, domain B/PASTA domain